MTHLNEKLLIRAAIHPLVKTKTYFCSFIISTYVYPKEMSGKPLTMIRSLITTRTILKVN